jgi:hypothetical protein
MNIRVLRLKERIAEVEYEIQKEQIKIWSYEEDIKGRLKFKDQVFSSEGKMGKWTAVNQMGLEQLELAIKIRQATVDRYVNEIKFCRLEIQEYLEEEEKAKAK